MSEPRLPAALVPVLERLRDDEHAPTLARLNALCLLGDECERLAARDACSAEDSAAQLLDELHANLRMAKAYDGSQRYAAELATVGKFVRANPPKKRVPERVGGALVPELELVQVKRTRRERLFGPHDLARQVAFLALLQVEEVWCIVLDNQHQMFGRFRVSRGTVGASMVPAGEVLRTVLVAGGVAFALAHNHPSGSRTFSGDDLAVTRRLLEASQITDVRFVEHLLVYPVAPGEPGGLSLATHLWKEHLDALRGAGVDGVPVDPDVEVRYGWRSMRESHAYLWEQPQ